jgi:hypothetical protein
MKITLLCLFGLLLTLAIVHAENDANTTDDNNTTEIPRPVLISSHGTIMDWLTRVRTERAEGVTTTEKASTRWGTYVSQRREVSKGKPTVTPAQGMRRINCTDSDNLTYTSKGNVKGYNIKDGAFTFEDTCVRKDSVREWYCHKDAPKTALMPCKKVGKGFACTDGACASSTNIVSCSGQRQYCAGKMGKQCCTGYTCKLEGNYPDAMGTCIKTLPTIAESCKTAGETCGGGNAAPGVVISTCCSGLTCKISKRSFDAPGKCA